MGNLFGSLANNVGALFEPVGTGIKNFFAYGSRNVPSSQMVQQQQQQYPATNPSFQQSPQFQSIVQSNNATKQNIASNANVAPKAVTNAQPLAISNTSGPLQLPDYNPNANMFGQNALSGPDSQGMGGLGGMFNSPQTQQYLQSQSDILTRLGALQTQIAQANVPSPAEIGLNNQINQVTNTLNNTNPNQYLKDNPSLSDAGISQGQLERVTQQAELPLSQELSNYVLSKSVLAQNRQIQGTQLGAEATGLQAQSNVMNQLRQLTMYGGLPPDIANTIIQRQLFPQYNVTQNIAGQPIAYNVYNPSQSIPLGQEGLGMGVPSPYAGSLNLPTQNNNPGDLRGPNGQFMQFNSPEEGFAALKNDLLGKMTGATSTPLTPTSSLLDFANVYAPASDGNNPQQYAQNLASQLGVSVDTPIGQLRSRLDDFANAVAQNEGYQSQGNQASINIGGLDIPLSHSSDGTAYINGDRISDKQKSLAQLYSGQAGMPPVLSGGDVEAIRTIDQAKQDIQLFQQAAQQLLTPGILGRVAGLTTNQWAQYVQSDPAWRQFQTLRSGLIKSVQGIAAGAPGLRVTGAELEAAADSLPNSTDNLESAQQAIATFNQLLDVNKNVLLGGGGQDNSISQGRYSGTTPSGISYSIIQ